jgi:hypothetical protein
MKLLLVFLLGMVVLGLLTNELDRRTYAMVFGGTLLTMCLFFFFDRFMV